jgi:uncharacterized RDD family membrane protein YckC
LEIKVYPSDQVSVDTPEQIALEFSLAGIGSRFLALALDTLLQAVLYVLVILLAVGMASLGRRLPAIPERWAPAMAVLILFCIYWGYFAVFEIFWHGQTPGKRAVGIRVVKDSGRPITAIEGIGRNLMRAVDGILFYTVGIITMLISSQNRRLGDYVAGTIVVHDRKSARIKPEWTAGTLPLALNPSLAHSTVTDDDLIIIETFLNRRWDLGPAVRANTAIKISDRLQLKTGLVRDPGQTDEEFLEAVARKIRDQARFRSG